MSADIDKLRSQQGANITYLRVWARTKGDGQAVGEEIERACDDIEAYREIVGLVLRGRQLALNTAEKKRLAELLAAMTWGNPKPEEAP